MINIDLNTGIVRQLVKETPIPKLYVQENNNPEEWPDVDLIIFVGHTPPMAEWWEQKILTIKFEKNGWWTIHSALDEHWRGYSIPMAEPYSIDVLKSEIILSYGIHKAEKFHKVIGIPIAIWFLGRALWSIKKTFIIEVKNRVTERWRNR